MKKFNIILLLVLIIAGSVYFFGNQFGLEFGDINLTFNSEKSKLSKRMVSFLEDIQFKDFDKAATYHSPKDQKNANIPKLIEEKFQIKPELMDIREYELQKVEIDRAGDRARILTMTHVKLLNSDKMRDIEVIYFWHKKNDQWYMQLSSSL